MLAPSNFHKRLALNPAFISVNALYQPRIRHNSRYLHRYLIAFRQLRLLSHQDLLSFSQLSLVR
jgi:hypothetical protein